MDSNTRDDTDHPLFLHAKFHPQNPSKQEMQEEAFQQCPKPMLENSELPELGRLTTFSHAPNIADTVRQNCQPPSADTSTQVSGPSNL